MTLVQSLGIKMGYLAQLNDENVVIKVHTIANSVLLDADGVEDEQKGADFLNNLFKMEGRYKQTSYNTRAGVHALGGTTLRANYCGKGWVFNEQLDIFHPPQPYPSWILDEVKGNWNPPVPYPDVEDGGADPFPPYQWNEEAQQWDKKDLT